MPVSCDDENQLSVSRVGGCGLDSSGSEYEPFAGSCERSNEPSCFIKGGEIIDNLSRC
jgi:hypothetical protein